MKLILETTKWDSPNQKNHVYLVDDSMYKMVGYIKNGSPKMTIFSKPMSFDKRRRTFKTIKTNLEFVNEKVHTG